MEGSAEKVKFDGKMTTSSSTGLESLNFKGAGCGLIFPTIGKRGLASLSLSMCMLGEMGFNIQQQNIVGKVGLSVALEGSVAGLKAKAELEATIGAKYDTRKKQLMSFIAAGKLSLGLNGKKKKKNGVTASFLVEWEGRFVNPGQNFKLANTVDGTPAIQVRLWFFRVNWSSKLRLINDQTNGPEEMEQLTSF